MFVYIDSETNQIVITINAKTEAEARAILMRVVAPDAGECIEFTEMGGTETFVPDPSLGLTS